MQLEDILAANHLTMLRGESGISDEVISARGYRTITDKSELLLLGFSSGQCRAPGLLLPLHTADGGNTLYVYRPDNPRVFEQKGKGKLQDGTYPNKVIKYELPKGSSVRVDCPPVCRPMLADPSIPLWVTEGQKKADALASHGLCAIDLLGVWNFKGKNEFGGTTLLADFDYIAFDRREVRIVFDNDVMKKPEVGKALDRLKEHLNRKGASIATVYLPGGKAKVGVDDWLAQGHTIAELEDLLEAPRPVPRPVRPQVKLLDTPPQVIQRPLSLIAGRAYAASWLHVEITITETSNSKGEIIRYDPPKVTNEQCLFLIRDDGKVFGPGGDEDVEALGLDVHLLEIPPADRLWSSRAIRDFRAGRRPNPEQVFHQVVDVVNRFIDFDRSLGDQTTMAQMVGCYILATWFLDAFNVIGFLWPNGDRGSGKTQLLTVICELAYLGQVILSGGSFASLRDLADYGACLAFDDAEGLSDVKRTDPDKRALLLAGNRKGNTVPVKELTGNKAWRTRYVNTFCPRLFSATRLPDPILASRTIVVPLIRTPDRYRANADPLDHKLWPHDRRKLIDDLWALGAASLSKVQPYEERVNQQARLTGRNLEPWRPILAVALWLDENGVKGLWERMETLSVSYQEERTDLEYGDLTALVIRALCANCANQASRANHIGDSRAFEVTSSQVAEEAKRIIEQGDTDFSPDSITSQRVGMVLSKLRLRKLPRSGGRGPRKWKVTLDELDRYTMAYGLTLPVELNKLLPASDDLSQKVGTVGEAGPVGTNTDADADLLGGVL